MFIEAASFFILSMVLSLALAQKRRKARAVIIILHIGTAFQSFETVAIGLSGAKSCSHFGCAKRIAVKTRGFGANGAISAKTAIDFGTWNLYN